MAGQDRDSDSKLMFTVSEGNRRPAGSREESQKLRSKFLVFPKSSGDNSGEPDIEKIDGLQEMAMLVHSLRNPASSILSATEYLLEDAANVLTEEQMTLLRGAAQSSVSILSIIENVLEFSKIENGAHTMDLTRVDLVSLTQEVVASNRPRAERNGLTLQARFNARSLLIELDPHKIRRVIDNLVTNAIKFSRAGGKVEIQVDANESFASVSVRDEGFGIPVERIKKIFEPFQRGQNDKERYKSGTGLGLAISKRLVDLHSGTISVHSQPNEGSTFTVKLPNRILWPKQS